VIRPSGPMENTRSGSTVSTSRRKRSSLDRIDRLVALGAVAHRFLVTAMRRPSPSINGCTVLVPQKRERPCAGAKAIPIETSTFRSRLRNSAAGDPRRPSAPFEKIPKSAPMTSLRAYAERRAAAPRIPVRFSPTDVVREDGELGHAFADERDNASASSREARTRSKPLSGGPYGWSQGPSRRRAPAKTTSHASSRRIPILHTLARSAACCSNVEAFAEN